MFMCIATCSASYLAMRVIMHECHYNIAHMVQVLGLLDVALKQISGVSLGLIDNQICSLNRGVLALVGLIVLTF